MKLIVCSVVDGSAHAGIPDFYGRINAWSDSNLTETFQRVRRDTTEPFLPVAAFYADPALLMAKTGIFKIPTSVWLGWMARWFGRTVLAHDAEQAIFNHYSTLPDYGASMFAAWELAVGLNDVV